MTPTRWLILLAGNVPAFDPLLGQTATYATKRAAERARARMPDWMRATAEVCRAPGADEYYLALAGDDTT